MLNVVQLQQINSSAPVQWSGHDKHDKPVYVRYDNGYLSVSVGVEGDSVFSAVYGETIFGKQIDSQQSNEFTFEQLKTATAGSVVWPEQES